MISVKEIYNEMYRDSEPEWKGLDANKRTAFEAEAYRSAIKKLDTEDKVFIDGLVGNTEKLRMKNFGEISMLELLAKLGMFLNANQRKKK